MKAVPGNQPLVCNVSVYFAAAPLILSEMNWVCPRSQTQ